MYDYQTALKQEWAVFCALAPKELVDLIQDPNPSHQLSEALETMLLELGFFELSMEYCHREPSKKVHLTVVGEKELTTQDLLRSFMDNIQSEGLHHLFDQRVGYLY